MRRSKNNCKADKVGIAINEGQMNFFYQSGALEQKNDSFVKNSEQKSLNQLQNQYFSYLQMPNLLYYIFRQSPIYPFAIFTRLFYNIRSFLLEDKKKRKMSMNRQQRKFTQQHNLAVIKLIKQKFMPLQHQKESFHKTSKSFLCLQKQNEVKSCHQAPLKSLLSLPSLTAQAIAQKANKQFAILDRAKQYINSNRQFKPNKERLELKEYIQLFQKPIELKGRAKKESISFNLMETQSRQRLEPLIAVSTNHEELQLNQQERSIMNAKIRRKLNHKKIIDLAKRY